MTKDEIVKLPTPRVDEWEKLWSSGRGGYKPDGWARARQLEQELAAGSTKLTRRSIITVNTDQAVRLTIEFVPGPKPYIWVGGDVTGFRNVSGFINDADKRKLKRMADSL